jgi:hypothetical protein
MFTRKSSLIIVLALVITIGTCIKINASNKTSLEDKVEKRLEHAYNDIVTTLNLEDELKEYKEITYSDAINNIGGDVAKELDLLDQQVTIGSTEPTYYINKESTELIILFKEADGTNRMIKSNKKITKESDIWKITEKKAKGAPILPVK